MREAFNGSLLFRKRDTAFSLSRGGDSDVGAKGIVQNIFMIGLCIRPFFHRRTRMNFVKAMLARVHLLADFPRELEITVKILFRDAALVIRERGPQCVCFLFHEGWMVTEELFERKTPYFAWEANSRGSTCRKRHMSAFGESENGR